MTEARRPGWPIGMPLDVFEKGGLLNWTSPGETVLPRI